MNRKKYILLITYVLFCVFITGYNALQTTDNVKSERYGISTDDTIQLGPSDKIKVEFTMTEASMDGISVKYQSENEFQNEKISAKLFDSDSDMLLAEDEVLLKNERIQNKDGGSSIYFRLPVENQAERTVYLELSLLGEDTRVIPSLVVSKSKVNESFLYVNKEKMDYNLVFTTRYLLGQTKNVIGSVLNGILLLTIGGVVFIFGVFRDGREKKLAPQSTFLSKYANIVKLKWNHVSNYISRHYRKLGYIVVVAFCILFEVFFYEFYVEKALVNKKELSVIKEEGNGQFLVMDEKTTSIKQIFYCNENNLSSIKVLINPQKVAEQAQLLVTLSDETIGKILKETYVTVSESMKADGESYLELSLPETLEKAQGHAIGFELCPVNFADTELIVPLGNKLENAKKAEASTLLISDGEKRNENCIITIVCDDVEFLVGFYFVLCCLLILAISASYFFCFSKNSSVERTFVVAALLFGIIFGSLIGLGTVPDEPSHIDTAYAVSNEILRIPDSEKPGYIFKREEDIDPIIEEKQSLNVYHYERLCNNLFKMAENSNLVECAVRTNLDNAGKIYYLPQAMGITVGRLIGLGYMPTMMLGRFFSLIVYILLSYFAIRKLPFGKTTLFIIAILPISLQQAASFSYDAMINGVSFLYLSYCLYIIYGTEDITATDIAVVSITGAMMASVKGGVYVLLCLLPLVALGRRKGLSPMKRKGIAVVTIIGFISFAGENLSKVLNRFSYAQGTVIGGSKSSEIYTFGYLIRNPLRAMGIFFNTFFKQGDSYIRNLLGGNLAWREININWGIVILFLIVILLSCVDTKQTIKIKKAEKIYYGFISFGIYCCIELSMLLVWTPITMNYITGVQGRYFIPFFLLILFLLRNSFFKIQRNIDNKLMFGTAILEVMVVLQVIQRILE